MPCTSGCGRTLSQFALVAYIPGQLADFLDSLRLEIAPDCKPRAHVTILPPRPVRGDADLTTMVKDLSEETRLAIPFDITLGQVNVFPKTNVIYIGLERGERELHALHENLNCGQLEYDGPYPYHPHVTVAQEIGEDRVEELAGIARHLWATYTGPRGFAVDSLTFVQNVAPGTWVDVAKLPMAVPAGVCV